MDKEALKKLKQDAFDKWADKNADGIGAFELLSYENCFISGINVGLEIASGIIKKS